MAKDPKTGEWLEPGIGQDMSDIKGRTFKKDPAINVISKEEFEERVESVFELLWQTLSKSFGPYGAPTIIYNYPFQHVTKDGYTIYKSLSFDASETMVDTCISDLAGDICGRINYTVGDGTTSAIIATNNVYKNYRAIKSDLDNMYVLPRDVMKKYEVIKNDVIERLRQKARRIDSPDMEELRRNIHDVVYISSNGDDQYTDYIADLYAELGGPMITCRLAPDGVTKKTLVEGFKFDLMLNDRIYINNDDETCNVKNADVLIFGTTVNLEIYNKILKPLADESKLRGRQLIVAAPKYDETAVRQVIAPALNSEFARENKITLILTTYRNTTQHKLRLAEDFAMMMDTLIIDKTLLNMIFENLEANKRIDEIFNIDTRDINGLGCLCYEQTEGNETYGFIYKKGVDVIRDDIRHLVVHSDTLNMVDQPINLGYVKECSLSMNLNTQSSYFTDLIYNDLKYQNVVKEAQKTLEETMAKYQKLGTFNLDVNQCQERLYSLNLKMGIIEVGADTEMAQKLTKDAVDDAIKAAESAYRNGTVLGCNTTLIQTMYEMYTEETDPVRKTLIKILLTGFIDVYRTVLSNAFDDIAYTDNSNEDINKLIIEKLKVRNPEIAGIDFIPAIELCKSLYNDITLHKVIVAYSIINSRVFNVTTFGYTTDVINSVQTDEEILKAVIDLIAILITGNQIVVTQKHNFE